ncbi:MAG: hypothetical protein ABIJ08_03300 [Nanoarchaeota archaeon]
MQKPKSIDTLLFSLAFLGAVALSDNGVRFNLYDLFYNTPKESKVSIGLPDMNSNLAYHDKRYPIKMIGYVPPQDKEPTGISDRNREWRQRARLDEHVQMARMKSYMV